MFRLCQTSWRFVLLLKKYCKQKIIRLGYLTPDRSLAASSHQCICQAVFSIASCGLHLRHEWRSHWVCTEPICIPHLCRCGLLVYARGHHAFICKLAPSKFTNYVIYWVFCPGVRYNRTYIYWSLTKRQQEPRLLCNSRMAKRWLGPWLLQQHCLVDSYQRGQSKVSGCTRVELAATEKLKQYASLQKSFHEGDEHGK